MVALEFVAVFYTGLGLAMAGVCFWYIFFKTIKTTLRK